MGFLDSLLGNDAADASKAAAADTYAKQQEAIAGLRNYGDQFAGQYRDLATRFQPYAQAGGSALERLMAGLGLGGPDSQQQFTAAYRGLPGYEAGLDTGSRAITGNAAARGMLNSGGTLKALQRYGSDYEDKRSGDYLSRLMGLVGTGQSATQQGVATEGTGLQGQLGTRQTAYGGGMNSAGTIGQGDIAAANAQAAGAQNVLNAGLKVAGMVAAPFTGGLSLGLGGMGGASGASGANTGVAGGGYLGDGNQIYPGPGYYGR